MCEIGFQEFFHGFWRVLRFEVVIDLLPDLGIRTESSTGEQMITFDGVVRLANRYFRGDQADITDVMLRAGMMAAGQMDVQRRVDLNPRLPPVTDFSSVPLCGRHPAIAPGSAC